MFQQWLNSLQLLLPALLPSWRFFASVGPSPRIQFAWLRDPANRNSADENTNWHEFRARPAHVSFTRMLLRLFWNAHWNESLFLVSCCERLLEHVNANTNEDRQQVTFCCDAIWERLLRDLTNGVHAEHLCFRIVLIERRGSQLLTLPVFVAEARHVKRGQLCL